METNMFEIISDLYRSCSENNLQLSEQLGLTEAEFDFFIASRKMTKLHCDLLSETMHLSASRISRIVEGLVQKGILLRESDSKDRRAIKIAFTPKGRRVRAKIEEARNCCELKVKQSFTEAELQQIAQQLQKMTSIISHK